MFVIKRDGRRQEVHFDKITSRITKLSYGLNENFCEPVLVAQKVTAGVYKGVTTTELDELAAETAAALTSTHPDYATLAARIAVSNLHKSTLKSFRSRSCTPHVNPKNMQASPLVADDVYKIIMDNADRLDSEIRYDRDFDYDYFGFKTLERSYLLRIEGKIVERPQHMLMRVSVGIHKANVDLAVQTYHLMSERWFTHASPTLFNAGTPRPQLSSCFLTCMKNDSIEGIYDTLKECAAISKSAGGIGLSIHCIRATGSYIRGTNGMSNGIVPMLRVFNDTARSSPMHRFHDAHMHCVALTFQLLAPHGPHLDACNRKSNQQNLGTIKCSNLCTEIIEYTSPEETAVCNLASIALPRFVREKNATAGFENKKLIGSLDWENRYFDFERLAEVTATITTNLNTIIDVNFYPVETAERSNLRHRPIGIGVQGLADTFILLGMAFDSPEAAQLNKEIHECIYFAALRRSNQLAVEQGPYSTYEGSPVSKGILQHDMWGVKVPSDRWDWDGLRASIKESGIRNSLLVAPMPTASTSQILGNNECFEPYTSNIYVRRVLSGEFTIVNQHLLHDLNRLGLWSPDLKNELVAANGSVADIDMPDNLKELYKTVWEIKQRTLVDMAADRGAFIDQSQSFNVFMPDPNFGKLTSLHFYGWKKGLKTGMYYLRTRAAADAIKFTVDTEKLKKNNPNGATTSAPTPGSKAGKAAAAAIVSGGLTVNAAIKAAGSTPTPSSAAAFASRGVDMEAEARMAAMVCSLANKDECLMCGS
ncbi:MAG: hypothetical protein WDW38_000593 [Sanguina aurantia]